MRGTLRGFWRGFWTLRARILALLLAVALVPLALVGLWLTATAARSGKAVLRARLTETLGDAGAGVGSEWIRLRSALLAIAQDSTVQHRLRAPGRLDDNTSVTSAIQSVLKREIDPLGTAVQDITVRGAAGDTISRVTNLHVSRSATVADSHFDPDPVTFLVHLDIQEPWSGVLLGRLDARLSLTAVLPRTAGPPIGLGGVLTVVDRQTARVLLPVPFDAALLRQSEFTWAGDRWQVVRRAIAEPALDLVIAAPLGPFTQPFQGAARRGFWLLLAVASIGLALAIVLTGRMTRSLGRLAAAAEAVSAGQLDRQVDITGQDEVGRVASAFNGMIENLRRTLRELAQRESLAELGAFASEVAHEVRNPLTSIRLDLQHVEEHLPPDSPMREVQRGVLVEIDRLDRTVAGVLQLARSGQITLRPVDVRGPLRAALRTAQPTYVRHDVELVAQLPDEAAVVGGDAVALQRLFLNILLNAAQALPSGGTVTVAVERGPAVVEVSIRDDGPGIAPERIARVREPFFSTRAEGTGLGLPIADRVARAHGGELRITSEIGIGTEVRIVLPMGEEIVTARYDDP